MEYISCQAGNNTDVIFWLCNKFVTPDLATHYMDWVLHYTLLLYKKYFCHLEYKQRYIYVREDSLESTAICQI